MKIPLVIYTHSDYSFLHNAMIGQINKYVNDMDIHICYNDNASTDVINKFPSNWIKHTYTDGIVWSQRVYKCLTEINDEYVLFIHEDWIPINFVHSEILEKMVEFMKSEDCHFLCSYIINNYPNRSDWEDGKECLIQDPALVNTKNYNKIFIYKIKPTGYDDYYYYSDTNHIFQPAIWKKSTFEDFCKLNVEHNQNENSVCLNFMSEKNCYGVQNSKTLGKIKTCNSLMFPHIHVLSIGLWNIYKYKGIPELGIPSLKSLLESYGVDIGIRGICNGWEINEQ